MRVIFIASDEEVATWKRQAHEVRMNFSVFIRYRLNNFWSPQFTENGFKIPREEELAKGEASARSSDASGEVASRRLPKAGPHQPQNSIPADLPNYDVTIEVGPSPTICEHGAHAYYCQIWGCKFYEIPNGRR